VEELEILTHLQRVTAMTVSAKEISRLEAQVASDRRSVERLEADLQKAQTTVDETVEARRRVLLDDAGDNARAVAAADEKAAKAERVLSFTADALSVSRTRAQASELALAEAKETAAREQRASEIQKHIPAIEKAFAAFGQPADSLVAALRAAPCPESLQASHGLGELVAALKIAIPAIRGVLDSAAKEALRAPPTEAAPQPAATLMFLRQEVRA
jgi:hypothetical protein